MLSDHLPSDVAFIVARESMATQRLSAGEEACVAKAVEKRQREFRSGRNAAKAALDKLGYQGDNTLLPLPSSQRPSWPLGFVGSITHTAGFCAAAVAHARDYSGIGIDVEPRVPLKDGVLSRICTEHEQEWIMAQPDDHLKHDWGKAFFCIKETLYKVFNPIHEVFLGFQEADVRIDLKNQSFLANIHQREHGIKCVYRGRFGLDEHYVYASTLLEHECTASN